MSQNANDFPIEDLPDVKPHLISKLKRAGIDSIHELAVSIPNELVWDKGVGDDLQVVSELVTKARRSLIDSGLLVKEFCTAEEILERRKGLVRFSTGSAKLDTFLNGGIETQAVTEIAGEFGTGKSQICHTLCVTANAKEQKPHSGESGNSSSTTTSTDHNVIFIDTENTFRAERVHQIAEARRPGTVEEILKRIFVCKIYNSAHLEYVIANLGKYIEQYKANLVIVDSVISLHRAEYTRRETLADRQQRLNILLHKLVRLTEIYNIAIVITNQVQSMPDNSFGSSFDPIRLAGGNIMAHASTYRIFLRKAGRNRVAIMLDSPNHAYSQVKFSISEIGIQDVDEDKNSSKYSESGW
jgi:DNA repair protein RadA